MMNRASTRLLSTSARVHPSYLPYLHNASRNQGKGLKWAPPLAAALATTGYAVASYFQDSTTTEQRQATLAAEREREEARRQAIADAYGDRDSLEALERAVAVYEAQTRERGH